MARLGDRFPPPLSLEDQGLFALGYYHQKAYRPPRGENGGDEIETETETETDEETA
jgi:CRISPR-associated protein Csd1